MNAEIRYALLPLALTAVILHFVPRLSRPGIYFSVTVPPSFPSSDEGRSIFRRYAAWLWLSTAAAAGLLFAWSGPQAMLVAVLAQLAAILAAFVSARRAVLPYAVAASGVREVALTPREERMPGGIPAALGPYLILAAAAVWVSLNWSSIPDRFPVHWGLDGRPNRWADRSIQAVFGPLLAGTATCLLCMFFACGIRRWSRRVTTEEREGRFRRVMIAQMLVLQYFLAFLFAGIGILMVRGGANGGMPGWVVALGVVLSLGLSVVMIWMGQGGTRLGGGHSVMQPAGDGTPDDCWKAGIFYVNRNDPALLVEKRFGIGWTFNFGHPAAWLILAGLVGLPLIMVFVVK